MFRSLPKRAAETFLTERAEDLLRKDTPRKDVQQDVEGGTRLDHLVCSLICQKAEHLIFLRYVEREIERAEISGDHVQVVNCQETSKLINMTNAPPQPSQLGSVAKAKAKTMPRPVTETTVWDVEEEDPDLFEMITTETGAVQNQQIEHLETRMLNVEGMLSNILQHLKNLSVNRCTKQ